MKIGELARASGTNVETIRYYERRGILPSPPRTAANYRDYGTLHRRRLIFIRQCRSLGLTLAEVQTLLVCRDAPSKPCDTVDDLFAKQLESTSRKIRELRNLQATLKSLRASCSRGRPSCSCGILGGIERAAEGRV